MTFAPTLRAGLATDYAAFVRLFGHLGVHDPLPSPADFATHLAPVLTVACVEGEVVGYCTWRAYGSVAHVMQVSVDPRHRGHRIGQRLLETARNQARAAGCTRWYLNVKRDNAPALALYTRVGLGPELESWALAIPWAAARRLASEPGIRASIATDADAADILARLPVTAHRLTHHRARRSGMPMVLRDEEGALAGFLVFTPTHPSIYPCLPVRPALVGSLLAACDRHALHDRFDYVRTTIEGQREVFEQLAAAGAELDFAILQLGAPL